MSAKYPIGPIKLVTVNTAPERAKLLIGRMAEQVKDKYTIIHAVNVEKIEDVAAAVREHQPDMLFTASMWTPEESLKARSTAKEIIPTIKTFAIPQGLQVNKGPDAVVEFVVENLPGLIEGDLGNKL
ncbi:hypothetical protein EJ08DRAFT_594515 [Tothia fuscella]|uniref:Uncharacterized protein n=1 Tax=Tothia fuscella TaxID=1048955 RepID=A0A9P4TV86_9PEZI|nr:hypothetical protein EJ08DRAFT_594515 [Tothia fuscella]